MRDRLFISDSQVHIWKPNSPERPWTPGATPPGMRTTPFGLEDAIFEMDRAGVDRAVIVPPYIEAGRNDLALAACAKYPGRFGIMGLIGLEAPATTDIAKWRDQPGMLGARFNFHQGRLNASMMTDGTADWIFRASSEHHVPLMLFAPGNSDLVAVVARRFPGAQLILDHLNIDSDARGEAIADDVESLMPLADLPNVAVKISALPCLVNEGFPFPTLQPHIRRVIAGFGADRCMWGSDLSRLPCDYIDWIRAITEALSDLSAPEIELIVGGTLANWLDWPMPDSS